MLSLAPRKHPAVGPSIQLWGGGVDGLERKGDRGLYSTAPSHQAPRGPGWQQDRLPLAKETNRLQPRPTIS